ncbi:pentatricopeptide repeat-containing protein At2g13600 [Selaginella moellendorffii]|nr:pentatricopeptide repeat-containing protein At2g13600 [Selaginella moellendorffii]|eukprot:XP_002993738.2 pentatricopeptide repeat-containing protein At2g13600 [Selaginella moellendorffii]
MRWVRIARAGRPRPAKGSIRRISLLAEHRPPIAAVRAKLAGVIDYLRDERNRVDFDTIKSALVLCSDCKSLPDGRFVHSRIVALKLEGERSLSSFLIFMYAKCGDPDAALAVFAKIKELNQACWNGLLTAFILNGRSKQAIHLFRVMQLEGTAPNRSTFVTVFNACTRIGSIATAKGIYASIAHLAAVCSADLHNALLNTYCKLGSLADAIALFAEIVEKNVVSWTLLVSAFSQHGHLDLAIVSLQRMHHEGIQPNRITFLAVLDACIGERELVIGRTIHRSLIDAAMDKEVSVATCLVDMYTKCGSLDEARAVFDGMGAIADVITWTAMISAYVKSDQAREALRLFRMMQLDGVKPNCVTCLICLNACASLTDLREGRFIHEKITQSGFQEINLNVGNALVDMYGTCGNLAVAKSVFDQMLEKDKATWNSLIGSFSQFSESSSTLELFFAMQLEGVYPDAITFVGVLFACNSAGMLADGHQFYVSMLLDFGIECRFQHCGCILDLLARVGWLDFAEEYVRTMPFYPDDKKWMTLLGSCKIHGDIHRAERAAQGSIELTPGDSSPYVVLCNVYVSEELDEMAAAAG